MSSTLIATLGGLWAMVAWGTSDWLAAKSSKQMSAYAVNLVIQLPGIIIWPLALVLASQSLPTLKHTFIISAAGICFTTAYISFVKALSKGHVGIVVPLGSTYPLITILLTVLFLSSTFTGLQYLAMFVIIAGIAMLAFERNRQKIPLRTLHRETVLALTAGLFWGLGNFLQNTVIDKENWISIVMVVNLSMYATVLIYTWFISRTDLVNFRTIITSRIALLAGAFLSVGSLGFYFGSSRDKSVIIPSVVTAASPLVASSLGYFFDREKLTLLKRVGAAVAVAGIILLNLK